MTSAILSFRHATQRNTKAYVIELGHHRFFISYDTIVAYYNRLTREAARLKNHWGPTTGRHIKEMDMHDAPIVKDEEFNQIINRAVATTGHELTIKRLEGVAKL